MKRDPSTLEIYLAPLQQFLEDSTITEIVINRPGEVLTEGREGWQTHQVAPITFDWCLDIAKLVANLASAKINEEMPMLSAQLPGGERLQVVIPPTVPAGTVSMTIRRPSTNVMSLDAIFASGAFENTRCVQSIRLDAEERAAIESDLPAADRELLEIFRKKDWRQFLARAILRRKNIIVSGRTGSGKTTLGNALASLISASERLITVEDVREMRLPHQNIVSMVYTKDALGVAKTTPKQIFEANLRMRPDRVLPAELRGDESFFFVQNVLNSGHPGTITTVHANSAKLVFKRLAMMIKTSDEGSGITLPDILEMLYALLDITVQMEPTESGQRVVTEIYYDPAYSQKMIG
jgi:type IV secretion system protein VirB11